MLQNLAKKHSSKSLPNNLDLVLVGRIRGVHGLKGWLKFEILTDFVERILPDQILYIRGEPFTVKDLAEHSGRALVRFAEITNRTLGETFYNAEVFAENIPLELGEDEFQVSDLIGLSVITTDGRVIGNVTDISAGASQDLLVIGDILIPMVKEFVKNIDREKKLIQITPIEGLLDR